MTAVAPLLLMRASQRSNVLNWYCQLSAAAERLVDV